MKSFISKKRLTEEERRTKQSLDSPQMIEANKNLTQKISDQMLANIEAVS